MSSNSRPAVDRPWRRPGRLRYAVTRIRHFTRPPVVVDRPAPGSVVCERDVPVIMRDGVVLRANVYRPPGQGPFPVLMSAHPYGKDKLPSRKGRRSAVSFQYRLMNQAGPVRHSTLTSWEAPDPAWWAGQGYAVVNADSRGAGTSQGTGALLSDQEALDYFDLIEWAASRPWCSGAVGLLGVSYLAMSQYKVAALQPPALKAICPWEGMTDPYRDLMCPGGIYENGFASIWTRVTGRVARLGDDWAAERRARPLRDEWWQSLCADLGKITVPMLVCASFSDNNLHSRGTFRAFAEAGSQERFAYTHRGGKWQTFYSAEARQAQLAFFDRYLRGAETSPPPRVRLEVRESRDRVVAVRDEQEWPLARTRWKPLYLSADGELSRVPQERAGTVTFRPRRHAAAFSFEFPEDTELTGPMALRLWLEVRGASDLTVFAGAEKWARGRWVGFEGSYGYGRDRVATGWQRAALRELDRERSTDTQPVHTFRRLAPLRPGEVVPVDIALGPSSTLFRAGESLRLVVAGRWLAPRNPLTGQFPAGYRHAKASACTLHWGPGQPARLLVPCVA